MIFKTNKMKTLLIFLLIPFFSFSQFIEKDKQMHLLAGASSGSLAYSIAKNEDVNPLIPTVGFATFMGLVKETIDEVTYGGFDFKDLAFTTLGGLASYFVLEITGADAGVAFGLTFGTGIGLFMIL
jgi:hypothetical protein